MLHQPASSYRLAHIRLIFNLQAASLILIFKRRLFHKDNPRGYEGNQNSENEQRIPSFPPLLSSLAAYSYFSFRLFSFAGSVLISLLLSVPAGGVAATVENKEGA